MHEIARVSFLIPCEVQPCAAESRVRKRVGKSEPDMGSVVDPHHLNADPDSDFLFDADPDPTFDSDADPDPDPDPSKKKVSNP